MLKKIKKLTPVLLVALSVFAIYQTPSITYAATSPDPNLVCHPELQKAASDPNGASLGAALSNDQKNACEACVKTELQAVNPNDKKYENNAALLAADQAKQNSAIADCVNGNPIVKDLNIFINILAGLVGVVIVGVIIFGGIQYSLAGGKPEAVSAARKRLANAVVAFLVFLFITGFLEWLIPGGIF